MYNIAALQCGIGRDQVEAAVKGILHLAAEQMKKHGSFKLTGMLNFKLVVKPARQQRQGVHPKTKEPYTFKAKPASRTAKITPLNKLKEMINASEESSSD